MYQYKMVQIPRDLATKLGQGADLAANFLQGIVDQYAAEGWEFYRIDNLTITEKAGCLGLFLGKKDVFTSVGVICFRKEK